MDAMSFIGGFALARRKGVASRDAVRSGLLGSVVGGGNPALGAVVASRVAERYVPALEPPSEESAEALAEFFAGVGGTGGGGAVATPPTGQDEPAWVDELREAMAGLKTDVETLKSFHKEEIEALERERREKLGDEAKSQTAPKPKS